MNKNQQLEIHEEQNIEESSKSTNCNMNSRIQFSKEVKEVIDKVSHIKHFKSKMIKRFILFI